MQVTYLACCMFVVLTGPYAELPGDSWVLDMATRLDLAAKALNGRVSGTGYLIQIAWLFHQETSLLEYA